MTTYRGPNALLDEARAKEEASRRLRVGAAAFAAAVLSLALATPLPFPDAVGLGLFFVLLPALGWAQLPLLPHTVIERTAVYAGSAATLVVLGSLALVLGIAIRDDETSFFPPLWGISVGALASWTSALVIVGLGVMVAFEPLDQRTPGRGTALVRDLLPRTTWEKAEFVGLSLVAGINEEVAYRGYALSAFGLLVAGPWLAVAASSIPFAILHAYQGPIGILRTGLVGFALGASVLLSGSLLPAILGHAAIDILSGLVVGPWLLDRAEREG
jgi:membrane protease YdiL (CAAX protease family)